MYNAVTFDLGTLLGEFFDVASGTIPIYIAIFAISNFLGPLTLGRLFDTVGPQTDGLRHLPGLRRAHRRARAACCSANSLTTWSFMAFVLVIFFIASAGASSAYLTVSEIFPMETQGALDRLLLRGRDRRRRDRGPAALRPPDRFREPEQGRDRLLHRRRGDDAGGDRRADLRRPRRAEGPREHRQNRSPPKKPRRAARRRSTARKRRSAGRRSAARRARKRAPSRMSAGASKPSAARGSSRAESVSAADCAVSGPGPVAPADRPGCRSTPPGPKPGSRMKSRSSSGRWPSTERRAAVSLGAGSEAVTGAPGAFAPPFARRSTKGG